MPVLRQIFRPAPIAWPYPGGTAIVTGASSGIGAAIAGALAARGMSLLLVALPSEEAELRAVADDLVAQHHIRAEIVPLDLTERGAPDQVLARAEATGLEPDVLVNCAGIGVFGPFAAVPRERQLAMVRLNIDATVALTGIFLPRMVARRRGAVLLVASTAAFQPMPYHAVYAATKAFVLRFGEALWAECRQHGVRVVSVCPGPVAGTGFAPYEYVETPAFPAVPLDDVVRAAIDAIARDQPVVACRTRWGGPIYALSRVSATVLPQRRHLAILERAFRLTPRKPAEPPADSAIHRGIAGSE